MNGGFSAESSDRTRPLTVPRISKKVSFVSFIQGGTVSNVQPGILAPVPKLARYLSCSLKAGANPGIALLSLAGVADGEIVIVGIGQPAAVAMGRTIAGLRKFPTGFGTGLVLPSTSSALWCWLRGSDRGALLHSSRKVVAAGSPGLDLQ